MKKSLVYILLIVSLALGCGCQRRDLYDNHGGNVFLDIIIEQEPGRGDTRGPVPTGMLAAFCHTETMKSVFSSYLAITGGFVSVVPDLYHLIVYNYDTEFTILRNEEIFNEIEAYTNDVPVTVRRSFELLVKALAAARAETSRAYANDPLIQEPDHLYVGTVEDLSVPASSSTDDVIHIPVKVSTLLETYDFHISRVMGMQYIKTVELFITGQVQSRMLYNRAITGVPSTIYVPLQVPRADFLSGAFCTFGRYPDEPVYMVLRIVNLDNRVSTWEWDVTDQVENGNHYIEVETEIRVPIPTGSGGFDPDITDWGEIITDIYL